MGTLVVQKYGGTSVANSEKIVGIAKRIANRRALGESLVVVVSAMNDTTDELLQLAKQITAHPPEREMDMLLTAGERISMALLSMALKELGVDAISFTGSQAGIITDEKHTQAEILEIRAFRVQEELQKGKVVIVAGFQGVSRSKEVTTLGRGGSDTTAVMLAAHLKADRCEIYTDVSGIYSADPKIVPTAKPYRTLPLSMIHEMAICGAEVMHPRSIQSAIENQFQLFVGHSESLAGTLLYPDQSAPAGGPLSDGSSENAVKTAFGGCVAVVGKGRIIAVIGRNLSDNEQVQARVQEALKSKEISVDGLTCFSQSIRVGLSSEKDKEKAIRCLHEALSLP